MNFLTLAIVGAIAGGNIYLQWVNAWIACGIAVSVAFGVGLAVEKFMGSRASNQMRKEYGRDWN